MVATLPLLPKRILDKVFYWVIEWWVLSSFPFHHFDFIAVSKFCRAKSFWVSFSEFFIRASVFLSFFQVFHSLSEFRCFFSVSSKSSRVFQVFHRYQSFSMFLWVSEFFRVFQVFLIFQLFHHQSFCFFWVSSKFLQVSFSKCVSSKSFRVSLSFFKSSDFASFSEFLLSMLSLLWFPLLLPLAANFLPLASC